MAFTIEIPFQAFKLTLFPDGQLLVPANDIDVVSLESDFDALASRFQERFQDIPLDKGRFSNSLSLPIKSFNHKDTVKVDFPADKQGFKYPAFQIDCLFFYQQHEKGWWAVLPAIGLEAFAPDVEELKKQLAESIKLEFKRKGRLRRLHLLIATIWFEQMEVLEKSVEFSFPSLKELEKTVEYKEDFLLPRVATPVQKKKKEVFGRKNLLEQIWQAIHNQYSKNVILVGPPGVGKTVMIREMARQLETAGEKTQIWETTASAIIKELMRDTSWQDNLPRLSEELGRRQDFLFVTNLLELFEIGQYIGNDVSVGAYMLSFIQKGELMLLSECTEEELAKIELKSPSFSSNFQIIRVDEPQKGLEEIIRKRVEQIARSKKINIKNKGVEEAVYLNRRFSPYAGFPGKPIRFLENIIISWDKKSGQQIDESLVINAFCEETGMPPFMVDPAIELPPSKIRAFFFNQIFGQDFAVNRIVDLLLAVKAGLAKIGKPIASFLFVGPTGVGKTEVAKVLAEFMFGSRQKLVRFDMSEYSTPQSILRLIGSPYQPNGLLTSAVRRDPFCVLLFDEIEKSDFAFYDLLLQILGEGRLTDHRGQVVNFCSTIIIMTSNIGANAIQFKRIGWEKEIQTKEVNAHFKEAVKKYFRPELVNRIDQIIPFEPLNRETVRFVIEREIHLLKQKEGIQFRDIVLNISEEVLDYLADKGFDSKYGARFLQRAVKNFLMIPLAKKLNEKDMDDKIIVNTLIKDDALEINLESDPLGLDLYLEELEKINLTEIVTLRRRKIKNLSKGGVFIGLLSALDQLNIEHGRLKEKFWEQKARVKRFSELQEIKSEQERLTTQIEELEMQLSLICMGLKEYQPKLSETLDQWDQKFLNFKIDAYSVANPGENRCFIGIYGKEATEIIDFYLALFKLLEVDYNGHFIVSKNWKGAKEVNRKMVNEKFGNPAFGNFVKGSFRDLPEAEDVGFNLSLYGAEFELTGKGIWNFLKVENGVQHWELQPDHPKLFKTITQRNSFDTPRSIHRKDFYKEPVQRIIKSNSFIDNKLQFKKLETHQHHVTILFKTLSQSYKEFLDQAFEIG